MALVVLAQVVATITLCVTLVVMYWSMMQRKHVLPLALSYSLTALLSGYRIATHHQVTDLFTEVAVFVAYLIGDVGLVLLLVRSSGKETISE